jgi:hypothetical protein
MDPLIQLIILGIPLTLIALQALRQRKATQAIESFAPEAEAVPSDAILFVTSRAEEAKRRAQEAQRAKAARAAAASKAARRDPSAQHKPPPRPPPTEPGRPGKLARGVRLRDAVVLAEILGRPRGMSPS